VPVTTFKQSSNRHCQAEAFLGTEVNKLQSSQQLIPASKEPRTTQWFVRRESVCQTKGVYTCDVCMQQTKWLNLDDWLYLSEQIILGIFIYLVG